MSSLLCKYMSRFLKNGVEFGAKLFPLPASDSWQVGLCGARKAEGASDKERWARQRRCLATS